MVTEALVNRQTGEVVEIGLQKTPDEIMMDAREAARALERVISSNKRKLVEFNGKQFLEFPHWQTIGKFFHTTAGTEEAEFVKLDGTVGFKATAKVIDEKTGLVVGTAEAYCMKDEPNWKTKPLFQLASMAQTRAASKALSNKYRYVAILAGYEPTPGEEVDMAVERNLRAPRQKAPAASAEQAAPERAEIEFGESRPVEAEEEPATQAAPAAMGALITDKQRKMLFAVARNAGISDEDMKAYLWATHSVKHTRDLSREQFSDVLSWVETYQTGGTGQ